MAHTRKAGSPQLKGGRGKKRSFHQDLVLNRWMMRFFNAEHLSDLKPLADSRHEGIGEDGQTLFFHELDRGLCNRDILTRSDLRRYDLNIVAHWQAITRRRNKEENQELQMKYFQYLSLLFTEIYLDWYFNRRQTLLDALNAEMARYRSEAGAAPFRDYVVDDLSKVAYWSATGSGKTLVMHVNIRQYLHYYKASGRLLPDKIVLLTPNEDLSHQHLRELHLSGFGSAKIFSKSHTPPQGTIEIIDINKLGDQMGDKTVAVEAFEGNNLVLVDEGHRGTGNDAKAWMRRRSVLARGGFSFEYSATFGQSVSRGNIVEQAEEEILKDRAKLHFGTKNISKLENNQLSQIALTSEDRREARDTAMREIYAKCVLYDYSYKYFYDDGYGKESLILNMDAQYYDQDENARIYFTACLLTFYQQLWLWDKHQSRISEFNIEKPLWVFVGNTVSGEASDILEVVNFLAWFLNNPSKVKEWLKNLINDQAQILDASGNNIFSGLFTPLIEFSGSIDSLYSDILSRLFNAPSRQRLKIVNIKNAKGELALRVGSAEPFGLINIGDDARFFAMAEEVDNFDTERDEFGGGLFRRLNNKDSKLNVLIGSRKFTEGWSSWRVSTMGLLNMGRGEGSQIIQLFGRGVRLKGSEFSLKRSLPHERPDGTHLEKLETLNIFGVRANYIAMFKEYLREEGITPSDEKVTLDIPTQTILPPRKLKTLTLRDGYQEHQEKGFKRAFPIWLHEIPKEFRGKIKDPHVILDLYSRIQAISTQRESSSSQSVSNKHECRLDTKWFGLFDWDRIFLFLQEHKSKRNLDNLRLDKQKIIEFCFEPSQQWYTLYAPRGSLEVKSFADVRKQEEILMRLLISYVDQHHKTLKSAYEGQFYDVVHMEETHPSIIKVYQLEIDNSEDGIDYRDILERLKQYVEEGDIREISTWSKAHPGLAICFDQHLYTPLLTLSNKGAMPVNLRPLAFDAPSEVQFVKDLEQFCASVEGRKIIGPRKLYLLRNADRKNKGLGFALAGNFYPDFLMWLVDDAEDQQWLTFVDPKGLRNINLSDPKLGLFREIKNIESDMEGALPGRLFLNAFVLSATRHGDLVNVSEKKAELEDRHILFMDEGPDLYLLKMFSRMDLSPSR